MSKTREKIKGYWKSNRWFISKAAEAKSNQINEAIADSNSEAVVADGFEMALIGIAHRFGASPVACYDRQACIDILISRDECSHEEAEEHFEFNVIGSGYEHAPVFVEIMTVK